MALPDNSQMVYFLVVYSYEWKPDIGKNKSNPSHFKKRKHSFFCLNFLVDFKKNVSNSCISSFVFVPGVNYHTDFT